MRIVEKEIAIEIPRGHHQHVMIAQLPTRLEIGEVGYRISAPEEQWAQVRSVLDLVAAGEGNLKKLHFLLFPEAILPVQYLDTALAHIAERFRENTVTVFGVEHQRLADYRILLQRWPEDNAEALTSVLTDLDAGNVDDIPVNWCVIAVKESNGRLRVFLEAKSHPFFGEETVDPFHDLYRGKIFPLFRCRPTCFNFMTLICLDYIYRDLYASNISTIIERANELFFETRQRLDLLAVIECNPKPEHPAFRDVVNGFYGEYLSYTPGVRDTITLFCNTSAESQCRGLRGDTHFGHSAVVIHRSHKLEKREQGEFSSDDFGGLPICRLRFGDQTRLYYFNLPLFHELDPRTTRVPLKLHSIFRPGADGCWRQLLEKDLSSGLAPTAESLKESYESG
ncbi:MAG: hypothetical protein CVU69_13350 [Deltaproteobacteria bacterium HGW-Deltaproteobacteria-4]|nr:MAG: hypothetical protein CVU69_13350 [Deltaproteobacteria bacterium HGW-Deltaproteobacteria-4]